MRLNDRPVASRLPLFSWSLTLSATDSGELITDLFSSLLVLLPHAAHEAVGGDVEDESDHAQEHPHEEAALEGEGGTAHLIGASGLRRPSRRHLLPGRARGAGEPRDTGGAGPQ